MALIGGLFGVLIAVGVWLIVSGLRGVEVVEKPVVAKPPTTPISWATIARRTAIAVMLFAGFWWLTGWPMAGATAAGISLVVPKVRAAQRERDEMLERTEELARWCEMIRDSTLAGDGMKDAIDATARPQVSGPRIRVEVRTLSDRCDEMSIVNALRLFADDVADPICDQIVTSLIMVEEGGGRDLVPVLTKIVESVRRRASMRRRVETGRAKTYASARAMVGMTIFLAMLATLFASSFMAPFDSAGGQFWMALIGVIFTSAVWALVPLSRPDPDIRLLSPLTPITPAKATV